MRELTKTEVQEVSVGFIGVLLAVAVMLYSPSAY
jgi:hypothetical protein